MSFVAAGPLAAAVGCCAPGCPRQTEASCLAPAGGCESGLQPSCRSVAARTASLVGTLRHAVCSALAHSEQFACTVLGYVAVVHARLRCSVPDTCCYVVQTTSI